MKTIGLRLLGTLAVMGALAAVFLLYTDPQLMVQMAEQLWSCFG